MFQNQITLSAYMSGSAVYWAVQYGYRLWGNAYSPTQKELAHTVWLFYMSKFYEFFDTVCVFGVYVLCTCMHAILCTNYNWPSPNNLGPQVIMVLKGKLNQVSFLHIYHHTTISAVWWAITFAAPGGDGVWLCIGASVGAHTVLVHVFCLFAV